MQLQRLTLNDPLWQSVIQYAKQCSWKAGPLLAERMQADGFSDWERVFVALDGRTIAGYCTLTKTDSLPSLNVTPFIGFMFVGEAYRGHRLSEKLIRFVLGYAQNLGFERVYLVSREAGLYEQYGFALLAKQTNELGQDDQIFMISTR